VRLVNVLFTQYSRFGKNSGLGCVRRAKHYIKVALLKATTYLNLIRSSRLTEWTVMNNFDIYTYIFFLNYYVV
jgi:hypothetical protein